MSVYTVHASYNITHMKMNDRIKQLRGERGLTLQEVADQFNISRSSVSGWEQGATRPDPDKLVALARILGTTVEYLITGKELKTVPETVDLFTVSQYDLHLAAGNGHMQWEITEGEPYRIPRTVFERERVDPIYAKIVQVQGDSMSPWVEEGDVVMVDTSPDQRIRDGHPYALAWDGEYYLKKITRVPGGALQLTSVNPAYAPVIIPATEAPVVQILGRVFWRGG